MKTILFLLLTLALAGTSVRGVAQPVITLQPRNQTNLAGSTATFTVAATGTPPLPFLNARPSGNELILSWPTNAAGFRLQSTADMTPPAAWTDSAVVPTVVGARFTTPNPITGSTEFYRLGKP